MAAADVLCKICNKRRPRRFCPGVSGDICAICCGTEREVTIACPLECSFLREAHEREQGTGVDPETFPHPEVKIDESFLRRNEPLLIICAAATAKAALETEGAIDYDVREALAAIVQTYITSQSGLIYQTRPNNPIARAIGDAVQQRISDVREKLTEIRDAELLGIFIFLQRIELQHNNGRPKGRACIDCFRQFFPSAPKDSASSPSSGLILT